MHGLLRLISFFQYSHCMLIHFLNQLTIIFGSVPETGPSDDIIITRDSEVIMFSPRVFVCLCVCVLTVKDWCHTNTILPVHCWGYLVVQVMFHALITSLMTSQGHKVSQIFKLLYLRQYLS